MKKLVINLNPLQALRAQQLLAGLDETLLEQLVGLVRFHYVPRGQPAVRQGTQGDALLLIVSGHWQVIAFSEDGREAGWSFLNPGEFHGEVALIDGQPRLSSVLALTDDAVVGLLPRATALELMTRHPVVAERVLHHLCRIIRDGVRLRAALTAASAHARIFALLHHSLQHQSPTPIPAQPAPPGAGPTPIMAGVIENLPTQQALAVMANVSRESVSRALQWLIRQGIVEKDKRRLIVHHPDKLETLATGAENLGLEPTSPQPPTLPGTWLKAG